MAGEDAPGKAAARFVGGPRAIGALLPAVTRAAFRSRSAAAAQLLADWAVIVGPALASATLPRRLVDCTLTIACAGPVALELQHLQGPLAERINAHFGRTVVERFRFVQEAWVPRPAPERARAQPRPAPVDVPGLPPGELREALAALGGAVARAARSDGA